MWANLPAAQTMIAPRYQEVKSPEIPVVTDDDGTRRFWEMHDLLFSNQVGLKREDFHGYAERLELDVDRFKRELKDETHAPTVHKNFIAGVQNGVKGTPGLFLNGVRQQGVFDEAFVRALLG